MSDRDWRESAYLQESNWPEAIPASGPKREYGPYPWGRKTHTDPHDVDEYPSHHPDACSISGMHGGDVCPYCGVPLKNNVEVMSRGGRRGTIWDLARDDVSVPLYHIECYRERTAEVNGLENKSLEDFADV